MQTDYYVITDEPTEKIAARCDGELFALIVSRPQVDGFNVTILLNQREASELYTFLGKHLKSLIKEGVEK